jgi:hypothetical protein
MSDIVVAGPGFYSGLPEDGYRLRRGMYIEFPSPWGGTGRAPERRLRPPRRLPLSWGKGRSRAAAKRRRFRAHVARLAGEHRRAGWPLRFSTGCPSPDRATLEAQRIVMAEYLSRVTCQREPVAFAAYCEMAR